MEHVPGSQNACNTWMTRTTKPHIVQSFHHFVPLKPGSCDKTVPPLVIAYVSLVCKTSSMQTHDLKQLINTYTPSNSESRSILKRKQLCMMSEACSNAYRSATCILCSSRLTLAIRWCPNILHLCFMREEACLFCEWAVAHVMQVLCSSTTVDEGTLGVGWGGGRWQQHVYPSCYRGCHCMNTEVVTFLIQAGTWCSMMTRAGVPLSALYNCLRTSCSPQLEAPAPLEMYWMTETRKHGNQYNEHTQVTLQYNLNIKYTSLTNAMPTVPAAKRCLQTTSAIRTSVQRTVR